MDFVYGAITRCGRPFQNRSTIQHVGNSVGIQRFPCHVPRHRTGNAAGLSHQLGLGSSPFARHY